MFLSLPTMESENSIQATGFIFAIRMTLQSQLLHRFTEFGKIELSRSGLMRAGITGQNRLCIVMRNIFTNMRL